MNIVLIADSKYALQCGVTLQSFFNTNKGKHSIHVISTGMDSDAIEKLKQICDEHASAFQYYKIDEDLLKPYAGLSGWSKYTFMKLLIPTVLPEDIKRVLYLDVDLLVNGHLQNIYDAADYNEAVYGVGDIPFEWESKSRCGIRSDSPYINSGVMIMNLDLWRKRIPNFSIDKFIKGLRKKGFSVNDQDVINTMFEGSIGRLPYTYNVTNMFFGIRTPLLPKFKQEWKEGRSNPIVIHFTNSKKPWLPGIEHPYKGIWYRVLAQTPFCNWMKYNNLGGGKSLQIDNSTRIFGNRLC